CENLPSELISKLPGAAIKMIMQAYDKADRAMLLLSLEGEEKDILMNSFAEEGSALREMVEFDVEEVQNDKMQMNKVENKKDDLWKNFVMFSRDKLKDDKEFGAEVEAIVSTWVEELISAHAA